jgi:ABC-type lipoprotein release transport system permease subunit
VPASLLVRGHLRTRWRRYALLATAFALGLFGFFAVLTVTDGAREAIIRPLGDTLTGDVRVTEGAKELAGGRTWTDVRPVEAAIERLPGLRASPRLESSYITVRGEEYENWSAGLLLGVVPGDPDETARLAPYLVWGTTVERRDVFHPDTGKAYTPLVLGGPAAKRLNLTLPADGSPLFDQPLVLTSGRLAVEGSLAVPLTIDCVLVGVFDTGLEPLDKFTAFMPIEGARVLAGHREADPAANALVVRGGGPKALAPLLSEWPSLRAVSDEEFAFGYMGSTLVVLYAAAFTGLALFFGVVLVWLVHETGVLVRTDQAVLSSLRAIGIPGRAIQRSYVALAAFSILAGAAAAWLVTLLLVAFAPPLQWSLSGLQASIPWRLHPWTPLAASAAAVLGTLVASWATARRVQALNILDGLRAP